MHDSQLRGTAKVVSKGGIMVVRLPEIITEFWERTLMDETCL